MFRAVRLMVISTCHARKIVHAGCMSVVYVRVLNIQLWPAFRILLQDSYIDTSSVLYCIYCLWAFLSAHQSSLLTRQKKGCMPVRMLQKGCVCVYSTWASATIFRLELIVRSLYLYLPANRYMTPVTNTALICRWHTPKAPTKAALPSMIRHTNEHEIDKFCIPGCFVVGW